MATGFYSSDLNYLTRDALSSDRFRSRGDEVVSVRGRDFESGVADGFPGHPVAGTRAAGVSPLDSSPAARTSSIPAPSVLFSRSFVFI